MNSRKAFFGLLLALQIGCAQISDPLTIPSFGSGSLLRGASAVPASSLAQLAALYSVGAGSDQFGSSVSIKVTGSEVAIFSDRNYTILQSGCLAGGTKLVLEGYWRMNTSRSKGLSRYEVTPANTVAALCAGTSTVGLPKPGLEGGYGKDVDESLPSAASFVYQADKVDVSSKFSIIAHHGACRSIDECGYAENSLETIRRVETFGGDSIEIDVRVTSDGVPILFHDDTYNQRLALGQYCHGHVSEMPYVAVKTFCRLIYGENIPTVTEALTTIIKNTSLRGVWLDMKVPEAVAPVAAAIAAAQMLATSQGRTVDIFMGLPSATLIDAYKANGAGSPCLIEQNSDDVSTLGCAHWGPRFTRGSLRDTVKSLQSVGKSVYFWTINDQTLIDLYMTAVHPDGIISDRMGLSYHRAQVNSASILSGAWM